MSSLLAKCIGISREQQLSMDATIVILERRSQLARTEARMLVLDYVGWSRDQLSDQLNVSIETVRTYWKRIYRKTNCRTRAEARQWLESILQEELAHGGDT